MRLSIMNANANDNHHFEMRDSGYEILIFTGMSIVNDEGLPRCRVMEPRTV
jgi:hypothetical protein